MQFQQWLNESSLNDLYHSTVAAFPQTTKRQHSTDLVKISEIFWNPFLGVRTLFVKGLAQSGESGHEYNPIIIFKNVNYNPQGNQVEITANDGQNYIFEKLNPDQTQVLVRCNCKDFKFRFGYFDHLDHSLYGKPGKKYEALHNPGSANPQEMPGMCKHLLKLIKTLGTAGILGD